MMRDMITVGQWYLREDTQERFQVLDCDEYSGTVRVQMFDGTLDEIDEEAWRALAAEPVEPPEDWTGPLDNVEADESEEFANETAAGSEDSFSDEREPWESLLAEEGGDAQEVEEPDEDQWMKGWLAARDHSRMRVPGARSRA